MQIDGVAVVQPDDSAASPTHPLKSRALSAKLKAYIALLEKASMKDLHGLLLKEPKLEDDFSPVTSPTMSPERNTPRQGTEAGTVYTMIGTGRCDIDVHTETPDQVLSAETRLPSAELLLVAKGEKRKRSRNRSQLRAFDDPVWYAVSGQTLIASAGASGQLAAKHAAEELVAQGDVVTEIAGSPKKVDMRRQGNLELYKEDVLKQRGEIMESPFLKGIFQSLYQAIPYQEKGLVTERGYKWLYKKLYFRVVPEGQRKECEDLAAAEWEAEADGRATMEFGTFYEAMFNFVDIWCDKDDEDSYIAYAESIAEALLVELGVTRNSHGREKVMFNFLPPSLGKLLKELQESDARIAVYQAKGLSSRDVYAAECERLGMDPMPAVAAALDPKGTKMKVLRLNGIHIVGIGALIDVIRLNKDLEQIHLKQCKLEPTSTATFCNLVFLHHSLHTVDISRNQQVTTRGATAILRMLSRNRNISTCRFSGTVSPSLKGPLTVQLEANFHAHALCREEYYYLKSVFAEMDRDKDGTADLREVVTYLQNHNLQRSDDPAQKPRRRSSKTGKIKSGAIYRTERAAERIAKNVFSRADKSQDNKLDFVEILGFFYPSISQAALQRYTEHYEDESNPIHGRHLSCKTIERIFREYDADGSSTLSIGELQEGLLNSGLQDVWERYQAAFARYDFNRNDTFSLEEFVMLMAVLDPCMVVH